MLCIPTIVSICTRAGDKALCRSTTVLFWGFLVKINTNAVIDMKANDSSRLFFHFNA